MAGDGSQEKLTEAEEKEDNSVRQEIHGSDERKVIDLKNKKEEETNILAPTITDQVGRRWKSGEIDRSM